MSKQQLEDVFTLALIGLFFWGSAQVVNRWGWLVWFGLMVVIYVLLSLWQGWQHGKTY